MKSKLIIVFLCLLAIAGSCKKKPTAIVIIPDVQKTHLQRNHIFGTVKYLQTETYQFTDDSIPVTDTANIQKLLSHLRPFSTAIQQYSSDGWLLKYVKLNEQKDTILRRIYHYDNQAHPTTWEEFDSTKTMLTHGKYLYDHNYFRAGEQIFSGDTVVMAFSYNTDGIGNIINSTQNYGSYSTHTETKYNQNGLVSKITEYEPDGQMFKTVNIEYDNYGDEVNRRVFKAGNQLLEYTYNEYSQNGRLLKTIYEDKIHDSKETCLYSNFDQENNWQTEIKIHNNRIIAIRIRQITYY